MIRIKNLNKFYNKKASNEIHVINDVSLELPDKGLIAVFGQSGCGKTTLLNAIGGLDRVDGGTIEIDGTVMSRYDSKKWDALRNRDIGYVFQNFNLLNDLSVYDNLDAALKLAGVADKTERDERILHTLSVLGLLKYKKRRPTSLSGGQQQRVAIARAICKRPKIILADEPTGNLDERNSITVMDALKQISESCLVLLVTHESRLARFYADETISVADGKIVDRSNNADDGKLDVNDNAVIYLKDLENTPVLTEAARISFFADDKETTQDLSVTIVKQNGRYFVRAESEAKLKINYVTSDSEIIFRDEHYAARTKDDAEDKIDLSIIKPIEGNAKRVPLVRPTEALKQAFAKIFKKGATRKKAVGKFMSFSVFFTAAVLLCFAVSMLFAVLVTDPEKYSSCDQNVYALDVQKGTTAEQLLSVASGDIEILPFLGTASSGAQSIIYVECGKFLQTGNASQYFDLTKYNGVSYFSQSYSYLPTDKLSENKLKIGRMPSSDNEIVIDLFVLKKLDSSSKINTYGYNSTSDIVNATAVIDGKTYTVCGLSDTGAPTVFVNRYVFEDGILNTVGAAYFLDKANDISKTDANDLFKKYWQEEELDSSYNEKYVNAFNNGKTKMNEVRALYASDKVAFENAVIACYCSYFTDFIEANYYTLDTRKDSKLLSVYSQSDVSGRQTAFGSLVSRREIDKANYKTQNTRSFGTVAIAAAVLLALAFVIQYFMQRSAMIERIREIGIIRSIGGGKGSVSLTFAAEIFATLCCSAYPAYVLSMIIISLLSEADIVFFNAAVAILSLVLITALQFFFGMLPITTLLKKTPTEISVKYDL